MGFSKQAAEIAIKALGGIGEMTPSPESIVGWLLENQDQVVDLDPVIHLGNSSNCLILYNIKCAYFEFLIFSKNLYFFSDHIQTRFYD